MRSYIILLLALTGICQYGCQKKNKPPYTHVSTPDYIVPTSNAAWYIHVQGNYVLYYDTVLKKNTSRYDTSLHYYMKMYTTGEQYYSEGTKQNYHVYRVEETTKQDQMPDVVVHRKVYLRYNNQLDIMLALRLDNNQPVNGEVTVLFYSMLHDPPAAIHSSDYRALILENWVGADLQVGQLTIGGKACKTLYMMHEGKPYFYGTERMGFLNIVGNIGSKTSESLHNNGQIHSLDFRYKTDSFHFEYPHIAKGPWQ